MWIIWGHFMYIYGISQYIFWICSKEQPDMNGDGPNLLLLVFCCGGTCAKKCRCTYARTFESRPTTRFVYGCIFIDISVHPKCAHCVCWTLQMHLVWIGVVARQEKETTWNNEGEILEWHPKLTNPSFVLAKLLSLMEHILWPRAKLREVGHLGLVWAVPWVSGVT